MSRSEALDIVIDTLKSHCVNVSTTYITSMVNKVWLEQANLMDEMVSKTTAESVRPIMVETNITNAGRALAFIAYLCVMYESGKISQDQLILDTTKLAEIITTSSQLAHN